MVGFSNRPEKRLAVTSMDHGLFKGAGGDGRPRWRESDFSRAGHGDSWIGGGCCCERKLNLSANASNRSMEGCGEEGRCDAFIFAIVRAGARYESVQSRYAIMTMF